MVGIDLIQNERVLKWDNPSLMGNVFSPAEKALIGSFQGSRRNEVIAGRFAVKEAVLKALRLGIGSEIALTEIETLMEEDGSPALIFCGKAQEYLHSMGIQEHAVSISHDGGFTTAVVVLI